MSGEMDLEVLNYIRHAVSFFDTVSSSRRELLSDISRVISSKSINDKSQLTFICTHNSRRSQFGQVWAHIAAKYFGVPNLLTFSGGTEITSCDRRTVDSLRRTGLLVDDSTGGSNPVYPVRYSNSTPPIECFSKKYADHPNPSESFVAIMCCSDADLKCPTITGARYRFGLHYEDPKSADDTPQESATYDERCLQIATEMCMMMSMAARSLGLPSTDSTVDDPSISRPR
jgi:arsenate reductase